MNIFKNANELKILEKLLNLHIDENTEISHLEIDRGISGSEAIEKYYNTQAVISS